jgi:hypothetical protein
LNQPWRLLSKSFLAAMLDASRNLAVSAFPAHARMNRLSLLKNPFGLPMKIATDDF